MDPINEYGVKTEHDTTSSGSKTIGIHEHDFYEIYFLISGSRRYLMKHTAYDLEPSDMLFVPKKQLHRATSVSGAGFERYVLYFSDRQAELLSDLLGREVFEKTVNCGCISLPDAVSEEVRRGMERIGRELAEPTPLTDAFVTHLLQGIILNAVRYGKERRCLEGGSAEKVQKVAAYVAEHYSEEISLSDAARMACIEKTYFSKRFKQLTGFGFQEYLMQTRIMAAEALLTETKLSIGRIAEECGFSCGNYFKDVFKRYKGLSPAEYRKKHRTPPLFSPKENV